MKIHLVYMFNSSLRFHSPEPNSTGIWPYKYIVLHPSNILFHFFFAFHQQQYPALPAIPQTSMAKRQDPNRRSPRPPTSLPPQPSQLLDNHMNFTPYYMTDEEARGFPDHATSYLSNNLRHPAEYFAGPRNRFPGSDPIMDARQEVGCTLSVRLRMVSDADEYAWVKGGEAANQSTDEQIEEAKGMGEMSDAERVARDVRASILLILRS